VKTRTTAEDASAASDSRAELMASSAAPVLGDGSIGR
jgi:hypothetical protein